jgi:hypothetical protein
VEEIGAKGVKLAEFLPKKGQKITLASAAKQGLS